MASKQKVSFKNNPSLNRPWNAENGFVLKSSVEKFVIGKYINDELVALSDDDVLKCKEFGLKYDLEFLQESESETEEDSETETNQTKVEEPKVEKVNETKIETIQPKVEKSEINETKVEKSEINETKEQNIEFMSKDLLEKLSNLLNSAFNKIRSLENENQILQSKLNKLKSLLE